MANKEDMITRMTWQDSLGRTGTGRDIGKGMDSLTRSSISELGSGESVQVADCSNCGFISSASGFQNGCPNCGCKDFGLADVGGTGTMEGTDNAS